MDTKTQSLKIKHILPPAQLWIGQHEIVLNKVEKFLQSQFCSSQGCDHCITCIQIKHHQHHAITWFAPERTYTREQLLPLFQTLSFALASQQHHFFIIQKADFLTQSCANSLLKSLEEPPPGYHFILLAQRQEFILDTVQSRCFITQIKSDAPSAHHEFLNIFLSSEQIDPTLFLKKLEAAALNERETLTLLDRLLNHWITLYIKAIEQNNTTRAIKAHTIITLIEQSFSYPPMPGSSNLLWKNLFLHMNT